jgi:hypothetical protein
VQRQVWVSMLAGVVVGLAGCASAPAPALAPAVAPAPAPVAAAAPPGGLVCTLAARDAGYAGTCEVPCSVNALAVNFNGLDERRRCDGPPRTVNATLARTAVAGRWLGTMQGVQPEDPTRLEVVPNKGAAGHVARTPFGWFAVSELRDSATAVQLRLDTRAQVRPTGDDLAIIDRATALLPNPQVWNKEDNRQCPAGQPRLSLFCALMQATTELSGGVHYRQPAMQAVREELNKVDPARIKTHRIMDWNNHPATTLDEVHALLKRARGRVAAEMR